MAPKTFEFCRWAVTYILLIFHIIVTYFIFVMRYRKNKIYTSTFYLLYLMASLVDIGAAIQNFFLSRLVQFDSLKPWFVDHPMYSTILYLFSGYFTYFQAILHAAIAINRIWVAFMTMSSSSSSRLQSLGVKLIWMLPFLPLLLLGARYFGINTFVIVEGELVEYYPDPLVRTYHSLAGPIIVISSSAIAFILTLITIVRYRYILTKYQNTTSAIRREFYLFCQAVITLFFELLIGGYYIAINIANAYNFVQLRFFAIIWFSYVTDFAGLCNPIALMVACKSVRLDFLVFMHLGKITGTYQVNSSGLATVST